MARPGADSLICYSCVGILGRVPRESDSGSLYTGRYCAICSSSNNNSHASGDKLKPAYSYFSSYSYPETNPDGNLESDDV